MLPTPTNDVENQQRMPTANNQQRQQPTNQQPNPTSTNQLTNERRTTETGEQPTGVTEKNESMRRFIGGTQDRG